MANQIVESQASLKEETVRLQNELDAVFAERQWLIIQARKGVFPVSDIEQQLNQLTHHELQLKNDLSSPGEAVNLGALDDWESKVIEYLAKLKTGIDELKKVTPQTPEE